MVVVMSVCLALTSLIAYPFYILPIRQQRYDDICLGRSREFNLVLYDYISPNKEPSEIRLLCLILGMITIVELAIYVSICKYLCHHDISMTSILFDSTLRKRHKNKAKWFAKQLASESLHSKHQRNRTTLTKHSRTYFTHKRSPQNVWPSKNY